MTVTVETVGDAWNCCCAVCDFLEDLRDRTGCAEQPLCNCKTCASYRMVREAKEQLAIKLQDGAV